MASVILLPRDVWKIVIQDLNVLSAIRLRQVSRDLCKLVDATCKFSRLCRLAHVRDLSSSASVGTRTFMNVSYKKSALTTICDQLSVPSSAVSDEAKQVIQGFAGAHPNLYKVPEGILVLRKDLTIFIPWSGPPQILLYTPLCQFDTLKIKRFGDGKVYYFSISYSNFGEEDDLPVTFERMIFDAATCSYNVVEKKTVLIQHWDMWIIDTFARGSENILTEICAYAQEILTAYRPTFFGNYFCVRREKLYRLSASGKETLILKIGKDRVARAEDGTVLSRQRFEFGQFFCSALGTGFIIVNLQGKIVYRVTTKNAQIYRDESIIAFDTTVIILGSKVTRGDHFEVFTHELLRGVMGIGEHVVLFDGDSVFFV